MKQKYIRLVTTMACSAALSSGTDVRGRGRALPPAPVPDLVMGAERPCLSAWSSRLPSYSDRAVWTLCASASGRRVDGYKRGGVEQVEGAATGSSQFSILNLSSQQLFALKSYTYTMSTDSQTHKGIAATGLRTIEEVTLPTPIPAAGEVLVEMKYAAFSPVDAYQVDEAFHLESSSYPHVLGFAGAGFVKSFGEGVDGLAEGDRVRFGFLLIEGIEELIDVL